MEYTSKFNTCELSKAKEFLEEYGVAVLENVIDETTIIEREKEVWDMLKHLTQKFEKPIIKGDYESYKNFYELFPKHSMLLQQWGVGHCKALWNLRQDPRVIKVFEYLWDTKAEDLLTSFDSLSIHLPPEKNGGRGFYKGRQWLHTDQSYKLKGAHAYQGFISLYDINKGDASFRCLPGSHKLHEKFFESNKEAAEKVRGDWYVCKEEDRNWLYNESKSTDVMITCPKGSMVLWDSRTFHSGCEPFKWRKTPNYRMALYMCMTPRKNATPASLKRKIKAFENLRTTNHWPHKQKVFPLTPHTFGKKIADITSISEKPVLSDIGRKLAGY